MHRALLAALGAGPCDRSGDGAGPQPGAMAGATRDQIARACSFRPLPSGRTSRALGAVTRTTRRPTRV